MFSRPLLLLLLLTPALAGQPRRVDRDGDPMPDGALLRLGTTRWRAGATIVFVAYLDNRRILTANQDHVVQIWDETGKAVRTIDVSGSTSDALPVYSTLSGAQVAVSGDGKRLAVQGRDSRVHLGYCRKR
jgi:WD40 repeat protein